MNEEETKSFGQLVGHQVKQIILQPFILLWTFLVWILSKLDILGWWDQIAYFSVASLYFVLTKLGYPLQYKQYSKGAVLVTGASSGIGAAVAIALAEEGITVFAGVRSLPDAHGLKVHLSNKNQHHLIPLQLDVTSPSSVAQAAKQVERLLFQLDPNERNLIGIVNAATMPFMAPIETVSKQDWMNVLDVNTAGPMLVTSAFLPLLRNAGGRVVNVSSASAMTASPMGGLFSASKAALEAASDTLRVELFRWRIPVSLVVPGSLDTRFWSMQQKPPLAPLGQEYKQLYSPLLKGVQGVLKETSGHLLSTQYTTRAIKHALFSQYPMARYYVGYDAKFTWLLKTFLSDRFLDWGYAMWIESFVDEKAERRVKF
ncbi:hypothetical protein EDD86DRAFT_205592, partial [Gorgonomyces haynaldii]